MTQRYLMALRLIWLAVSPLGSVDLWGFPTSGSLPSNSWLEIRSPLRSLLMSLFFPGLLQRLLFLFLPTQGCLLKCRFRGEVGDNCSEEVFRKGQLGKPSYESWPSWLLVQLLGLSKQCCHLWNWAPWMCQPNMGNTPPWVFVKMP